MRKAAENMYHPKVALYLGVAYFMVKARPRIIVRQFTGLMKVYRCAIPPCHIPPNALYDKAHPADRVHSQTCSTEKQRNA